MVAHGVGAAKRARSKRNKVRQARKKAATAAPVGDQPDSTKLLVIPSVTEDDLLAFQISHFGIDIQPNTWFVDAEIALNYDPQVDDDGLGYYEDGVKRTLTDEQVEMFRHSEIEMSLREERLRAEQEGTEVEHEPKVGDDVHENQHQPEKPLSPSSDVSSMEDELLGLARHESMEQPPPVSQIQRPPSSRSGSLHSNGPRRRKRAYETPYEERHKRKWEDYIDENDPFEGSLTHRRIIREMDQQYHESVDLDY